MLRSKRNRTAECPYGCCRNHMTKKSYRARERRAWKRELF